MNLVAMGIVALNIAVAVALYYGLNGRIELPMMVGILCGAVTNTPGLGAANEALSQLNYNGPQIADMRALIRWECWVSLVPLLLSATFAGLI